MSGNGEDFRVRPGRIRSTRAGKTKSFVNQVLRAAKRAGHTAPQSGHAKPTGLGHSTFGRGRLAFSRNRLFSTSRRVVVKARIVRHQGRAFRSVPMPAHVAYLKREGVTRDGDNARMFDAESDRADDAGFAYRTKDDRHHFRFIVSPEDATEMTDLKAFTRDLARQMEADLGTRLDWIAVDHWNTDNPHIHLLVRGVDETGQDLVISRDYISRGLRSRAEELVSIELGPKPEQEIRSALERDVGAERWTRLDAEIRRTAGETGYIDLRPEHPGMTDPETRRLMIGRLQHLETMGLAAPDAIKARAERLADAGFASRQGQRIVLQRDLLATLRRRELDAVGAKLSDETGLAQLQANPGENVAGNYRQRLSLTSGRFAMIDNGLGFQLVPWSITLEKQLGRHVVGVMKAGGGIDWGLAPKRTLGL